MAEDNELSINQIATPIIAISALTALCYFAAPILIPLITAATLAYVLWPAVALLKRLKLPHTLAVVAVLLVAIIILAAVAIMVFGQASEFITKLPTYWQQFQQMVSDRKGDWPKALNYFVEGGVDNFLSKIDLKNLTAIPQYLFKGLGSVLGFGGQAILIVLLTLFMLIEQPGLEKRLLGIFGRGSAGKTGVIMEQISSQMAGYLWVRFIVVVALAIIFTLGLLIGGIEYPYIWGPLAAILTLVPYIGAFVGAVPPCIMAYIQFGSFLPPLWIIIFFMSVEFVEGNLIVPKLLGKHLNINLLAQLISTIFWGWVWGGIGIILAVPITAALKVFCDNVEALQPIGQLLSGDDS